MGPQRDLVTSRCALDTSRAGDEVRSQLAGALLCLTLSVGCVGAGGDATSWIRGRDEERWRTMERQLRGLDVAMLEIGERYRELYWAGDDAAWPYASYQAVKIQLALENGLERRPNRRASAEALFLPTLAQLNAVIAAQDRAQFATAFGRLTSACNACHAAEGFASFRVVPPALRQSAIGPPE